jgi:hypothetical protein
MKRILIRIALQLIAAAAGIFNILHFMLSNLLAPSYAVTDAAMYGAAGLIVLVTLAVLAGAVTNVLRTPWLVAALALTLSAGFVPRIADAGRRYQAARAQQIESQHIETKFLSDLAARKRDVEARIAERRPYTAEEALALIEFANDADLSYRSLPDYTGIAFALLEQALKASIVDPNGRLRGERFKDLSGESLVTYFYKRYIVPGKRANAIRVREWDLLQLLVRNGADLSEPAAAELKADLGKTVVREAPSRFMRLQ